MLLNLVIGGVIGYFIGRLHQSVRDMKKELSDMNSVVKSLRENERGSITFSQIVLALVLVLTLYAAVSSQIASNKTNRTADVAASTAAQLKRVVSCNRETLKDTLEALTERTAFSTDTAKKNIGLTEAQHNFLKILLHRPPPTEKHALMAAKRYNNLNQGYVVISKKALHKIMLNPIPSVEQFTTCMNDAKKGG